VQELRDDVLRALGQHHADHPLAPGMDVEDLRIKLRHRVASRLFRVLVEQLEEQKTLVRDGSLVRLTGHETQLGPREQALAQRVVLLLSAEPLAPPDVKQIETQTGTPRASVIEVIRVMERQRTLVRVSSDL
jgi:Elongation factor SelB, winged helix